MKGLELHPEAPCSLNPPSHIFLYVVVTRQSHCCTDAVAVLVFHWRWTWLVSATLMARQMPLMDCSTTQQFVYHILLDFTSRFINTTVPLYATNFVLCVCLYCLYD